MSPPELSFVPTDDPREIELQIRFQEAAASSETFLSHSWRGISVQYSRFKLPAEYTFSWQGSCEYLAHHDLILDDGSMEVTGERPVAGRDLRDRMTYVPAGQAIRGFAKPADRLNAFTVISYDPGTLEEEVQAELRRGDARAHLHFREDGLAETMRKLGRVMATQDRAASRIYIETLGLAAALEMSRIALPQTRAQSSRGSGGLSKTQEQLLADYIQANIGGDIGLDDLAGLCGLTRYHFCRAFKANFGVTPFQHVTAKRIERAQQMLAQTRLPVSAIATACGFSGASQFVRAFGNAVGMTPLAFRRSV